MGDLQLRPIFPSALATHCCVILPPTLDAPVPVGARGSPAVGWPPAVIMSTSGNTPSSVDAAEGGAPSAASDVPAQRRGKRRAPPTNSDEDELDLIVKASECGLSKARPDTVTHDGVSFS